MRRLLMAAVSATLLLITGGPSGAAHPARGEWSESVSIEAYGAGAHPDFNLPPTPPTGLEGCPFVAKDGRSFFIASDRADGMGGLDIWVSTRGSTDEPWGKPWNPGAPINTAANDFCPTLAQDGHSFFFVSTRAGFCGATPNADIYAARWNPDGSFGAPVHLGCEVNSAADEHSPFPANLQGTGPVLLYSSARAASAGDAPGDHDIYQSPQLRSGTWGAGELVPAVSTTAMDGQPNLSRDGLELYFYSNRTGTLGGNDIYVATRSHVTDEWGEPQNLGPAVNSAAAESRPSLSWDMNTLYFGSTRAGSSDIYVTRR